MSMDQVIQKADRASRSILGVIDVDITGAKRRYAELDEMIARLAVTGGRSVGQLKAQILDLANAKHVTEKEIVQSINTINGAIRSPGLATDVQPVLIDEEKKTGRNRQALDRFATKALGDLNVRSPTALRALFRKTEDVASATHFPGGAGGLQDTIAGQDLSQARVRNEDDRNRLIAFIAKMGHGQSFERAGRRAQAAISGVAGLEMNKVVRTLKGEAANTIDADGWQRDIPALYEKIQGHYEKRFETTHQRIGSMANELGDQANGLGALMFSVEGGSTKGIAEGNTFLTDKPIDLANEEDIYQANQRARETLDAAKGRQRFDQTRAGKRAGQQADDENFDTNEIGGRSQEAEDIYKQSLSPAMRRAYENTLMHKSGVATGTAVLAGVLSSNRDQAELKPYAESKNMVNAQHLADTLSKAVETGTTKALNRHLGSGRGQHQSLRDHVERESKKGKRN
jgi:hypothetical protein